MMQILQLRKHDKCCAECGNELPYLDSVNKMDGIYYHLDCAKEKHHRVKIKHLHSGAIWWINNCYLINSDLKLLNDTE